MLLSAAAFPRLRRASLITDWESANRLGNRFRNHTFRIRPLAFTQIGYGLDWLQIAANRSLANFPATLGQTSGEGAVEGRRRRGVDSPPASRALEAAVKPRLDGRGPNCAPTALRTTPEHPPRVPGRGALRAPSPRHASDHAQARPALDHPPPRAADGPQPPSGPAQTALDRPLHPSRTRLVTKHSKCLPGRVGGTPRLGSWRTRVRLPEPQLFSSPRDPRLPLTALAPTGRHADRTLNHRLCTTRPFDCPRPVACPTAVPCALSPAALDSASTDHRRTRGPQQPSWPQSSTILPLTRPSTALHRPQRPSGAESLTALQPPLPLATLPAPVLDRPPAGGRPEPP